MNINGKHYRTIWVKPDDEYTIQIIDQRHLPHQFVIEDINSVEEMAAAIKEMHLRGAGLIGAAAGYGMYLAALESMHAQDFDMHMLVCAGKLKDTRPTAVNLAYAVDRQLEELKDISQIQEKVRCSLEIANAIADEDADNCQRIGQHGVALIEAIAKQKQGGTVNVLTHCNAGWLAFVDHGSALSPVYAAHDRGVDVHVWVDETRPRNQGARLTAWELAQHGVKHTVIADNVGGHLMQHGQVDMVIVGSDRTTYTGDVANKIGTYLKALAAHDNNVPFYAALPSSTFDWEMRDGVKEIPIEERGEEEVKYMQGMSNGKIETVLITPQESPATNFGFDVTPSRLVTGIITERGVCEANEAGVLGLFPERKF